MTGFELRTSGVWSDRSINWATTIARKLGFLITLKCNNLNFPRKHIPRNCLQKFERRRSRRRRTWERSPTVLRSLSSLFLSFLLCPRITVVPGSTTFQLLRLGNRSFMPSSRDIPTTVVHIKTKTLLRITKDLQRLTNLYLINKFDVYSPHRSIVPIYTLITYLYLAQSNETKK